jgi:hypothetical protein
MVSGIWTSPHRRRLKFPAGVRFRSAPILRYPYTGIKTIGIKVIGIKTIGIKVTGIKVVPNMARPGR